VVSAIPSERQDVVIVGAGILGLSLARELIARQPGAKIAVLEREPYVAAHQTGHNSGVIHAGIYYKPGSLKAELCVDGARRLYDFCDEHGIAYERCGKVILATNQSEQLRLDELEARGRANGVEGLRRIGPDELRQIEPHATGIAALHSPDTGIVDYGAVSRAIADDLVAQGVGVVTGCEVTAIERVGPDARLTHTGGQSTANRVIVCSGAWSDRLAVGSGASPNPRIVPFRGAYMRLRPHARSLVNGLIYPVPNPELPFLGVHLTKRIDGEVILGPTALMVGARDAYRLTRVRARDLAQTVMWPGTWKMIRSFRGVVRQELTLAISRRAFVAACARYVPELTVDDVIPALAGVRAQALGRDGVLVDDFVIDELGPAVFVRNAPSPAATSALSIAAHLADRLAHQVIA
jgi:(S)-2-hydroxyglutarate dehydrogenase